MFQIVGMFLLGVLVLGFGASRLISGASGLAQKMNWSPFLVGFFLVAFATALPELSISLHAMKYGNEQLALGTVVGNNIVNFGLTLGLAAIAATLVVSWRALNGVLLGVIASTVAVILMGWDGEITRVEGMILIVLFIVFTIWALMSTRSEGGRIREELQSLGRNRSSLVMNLFEIVLAIALFYFGSRAIVTTAPAIGLALNQPQLIVGLLPVAVAISVPEAFAAWLAARRGHGNLVVGHVLGSSLINISLVIGLLAMKGGLEIPASLLRFELPLAAIVACLMYPMLRGDMKITKMEGILLFLTFLVWLGFELIRVPLT